MKFITWICELCCHETDLPFSERDSFRTQAKFQCDKCNKETWHNRINSYNKN